MRQRLFGILLVTTISSVGAFALPVQAAIERAAAADRRVQQDLNKSQRQGGPADPAPFDSSPVVILGAPHWTFEKFSRHTEFPQLDRKALCSNDQALNWLAPWKRARLNFDMVSRSTDNVAQPVRIHLIGAHAPPIS